MWLYEKVALVFLCLRVDSNLELSGVVTVSFIKVRSRQIGRSLHLPLAYILHSCGQIIIIAFILLPKYCIIILETILPRVVCSDLTQRPVSKYIIRQLELVHRDAVDLCCSLPLKGEGPAGVCGPDIEAVQHFQFARSQESISGALDPAALPLEGLSSVLAVPGLDVAQRVDVLLPSEHPQLAVSPAGPVPLQQFSL